MSTRQLVVHHDDIGANHATNRVFVELFDAGAEAVAASPAQLKELLQ